MRQESTAIGCFLYLNEDWSDIHVATINHQVGSGGFLAETEAAV